MFLNSNLFLMRADFWSILLIFTASKNKSNFSVSKDIAFIIYLCSSCLIYCSLALNRDVISFKKKNDRDIFLAQRMTVRYRTGPIVYLR